MAPRASDVFGRFCCWNPLPFCSIVALVLGMLTTFAILLIGYYYAYNDITSVGLCFESEYPSLRRTCLLDITGSVMTVAIACVLLVLECASAYINQRDWRIVIFFIKLFLIVITLLVLFTATIYGLAAYLHYCDDSKRCKFSHRSDGGDQLIFDDNGYSNYYDFQLIINESVDFVVIIITLALCTAWWSLWLLVEGVRTCLVFVTPENYQNSRNAELQPFAADDHATQPQELSTYNFTPDYD